MCVHRPALRYWYQIVHEIISTTPLTTMSDASQGAAPPPDGRTPDFGHPTDVLHTINLVSSILGIAMMAPFVIGRMFIKLHMLGTLVLEDCTCFCLPLELSTASDSTPRLLYSSLGKISCRDERSWTKSHTQLLATGYFLTGLFSKDIHGIELFNTDYL